MRLWYPGPAPELTFFHARTCEVLSLWRSEKVRTGTPVVTCCSARFSLLCSGPLSTTATGRPVRLAWVPATHHRALFSALRIGCPEGGEGYPNLETQQLSSPGLKNQSESLHTLSVQESVSSNSPEPPGSVNSFSEAHLKLLPKLSKNRE